MRRHFSKKGKQLLLKRVLPIGAALIACTGCAYVVNSAQYNDRFLPGTTINGIDVSDKTIEEVEAEIRGQEEDYSIKLRFRGGEEAELSAEDVALSYDCGPELQQILNEQNRLAWLTREFGDTSAHTLSTTLSIDKPTLVKTLLSLPALQEGNYEKPENAALRLGKDFVFSLVPEVEGSELNTEELAKETEQAITAEKAELDLTSLNKVYEEPTVRSDNEALLKRRDELNKFLSAKVTIKLSGKSTYVVDKKTTISWVSVDSDGQYAVNADAVERQARALMAKIAEQDDNYGYFRSFLSTNFGMQQFESENLHGHTLNQERMAKTLAQMLLAGRSGTLNSVYSQIEDELDPRFGGSYVEVDIYNQHVYVYQDYELVYDCSCVTGTEGYSSTPSGIFDVDEKIRGRELQGYRSDGSLSYSVHVDYWIRFIPHYGLHDASWRGSFGGDIYEYDGSHGCVNLPHSAAATIYDLVDYGTPVIVLRGTYRNSKTADL
jgi:hypothetical protein